MSETESLLERVRRRTEKLGLNTTNVERAPTFEDDLIPEVSTTSSRSRTKEDDDIDAVLDGLDIIDAYRRWCGKMEPNPGARRESVMVSCPIPGHRDKNPSAWLNLDKRTWFCGACQQGGDAYDLAAFKLGYAVPGYKNDGSFVALRRDMAEDLGYVVQRTVSGREYLSPAAEDAPAEIAKPSAVTDLQAEVVEQNENQQLDDDEKSGAGLAPVLELPTAAFESLNPPPTINWRELLPDGTFLRAWMEATTVSDLPEEYYFWLGCIAVGFAAGNDVELCDDPAVRGNLFVCLYGPSGIGKTRSTGVLRELLRKALPYDRDNPRSKGVSIAPMAGSAEALVDIFSKPEYDPTDPTKIVGYCAVRGLVRFDELSSLVGRANRTGSTLKPTLMEFFDSYGPIELVSRGHGHVKAEGHFASAITTTQPNAIRSLLQQTDADSGFVNRWVFASGPSKKLRSYGRHRPDVDALVPLLQGLRTWASTKKQVDLVGDAFDFWDEFFSTNIEPIRKSDDASLLTRIDLMLKKLILLFAINEQVDRPSEDLVRRACSLYEYLRATYESLAGHIGLGAFEDCRTAVGACLRELTTKTSKPASIRELNRAIHRRYPRDLVARVIKTMIELGEVEEEIHKPQRGPTSVRYRYVG